MFIRRLFAASFLASLLLAGCGGGDDPPPATAPTSKGSFTAIVSFGDSLSDVGTYAPATSLAGNGSAPYLGGKFTTNGPNSAIWIEDLAATLKLTVTPAEVGFDGHSIKCPAAAADVSLAGTCTAYGQGGARISDPEGIGHNDDGSGALTVPVVTQIANHLARFGSFKSSDLILVYAGNNDVLLEFAAYALSADDLESQVAAGTITAAQAAAQLATMQQAVEADAKASAGTLASTVKSQIVGKGGSYIAVMTLSDIGDTPFGRDFPDSARAVLTHLSQVFNDALRAGLADAPVKIIDTYAIFKDVYTNPGKYGFVNNTTPACDVDKIAAITGGTVGNGSSLFCNATRGAPYNGLTAGADPITWQFADDLHPTTGGHRAIADAFTAQLVSFGWI